MQNFSEADILLLALGALGFGMWLLIKGGDATIDGATAIAKRFNISKLVIGFTIVAFGTSLPELIVSVNANYRDSAGIALGNVIGSNIANILLVIGAASVLYPVVVDKKEIRLDAIAMLVATAIMATLLLLRDDITSLIGGLMIALLAAYVCFQYYNSRKNPQSVDLSEIDDIKELPLWHSSTILIFGLFGVALGADVLVRGAITAATILNVPEALIGLSVIAIGTSLPELATSITAALKKETGIVVGNVLGSNTFNILLIIGVTAGLKPIGGDQISPEMASIDVWVMSAVAVLFALVLTLIGKIGRISGVFMLIAYKAYIIALYFIYTGVPSA